VTPDPFLTRPQAEQALFGGPVWFAPIRHHSPACAWALRAMIREHRPELVLIEAPSDLAHHIPMLADREVQWPVAILALCGLRAEAERRHVYIPFCEHSPEAVAVIEAAALGAEVRFIDLPCGAARQDRPLQDLQSEQVFDSGRFIAETCARLGLRDGTELWDHLFETRLGHNDWRGFFGDVLTYCTALRASTAPETLTQDDTLVREAAMRGHLARINGKRAVVVTGGFHTPALCLPNDATTAVPPTTTEVESYLIGYGEDALDALSGYAAGIRYPAWHRRLWRAAETTNGPPDWTRQARDQVADFAADQAAQGHPIGLPQQVEMLALAHGLAALKGRQAVLLPDLFDGLRTALIKGEAGLHDPWTRAFHQFLRGSGLGRAPRAAGQPPLIQDARTRAQASRFDLSSSIKRTRKLDFRRKPAHALASRLCHQMGILDTGFAALLTGPDLVAGHHLGLLFEDWEVAWSPFVEGRLLDAARLGANLPQAAARKLTEHRLALADAGLAQDVPSLMVLLLRGLRAGLGQRLLPLVQALSDATAQSGDILTLAEALRRLLAVSHPGDPLHDPQAPDLQPLALGVFDRMIYLCDDLPNAPDDTLGTAIAGLRMAFGALLTDEGQRFDRNRLDAALQRIRTNPACPPLLLGAVAGLQARAGQMTAAEVASLLGGALGSVTLPPGDRAALLDGLTRTGPMLLWQSPLILAACEAALAGLDDDAFIALLPALRLSLTQLNPHEVDRLAQEVAGLLGVSAGRLAQSSAVTQAEMARGLALDRALAAQLAADGLQHWGAVDA